MIVNPATFRKASGHDDVACPARHPQGAGSDCNESRGAEADRLRQVGTLPKKNSPSPRGATTIEERRGNVDATGSSMLKKDLPNVLPLHLVPIDSFFLADDQLRYPMTSIIRIEFQGEMDRLAFGLALEAATERHPLTRAVIRPAKQGLPCWVEDASIRPVVDVGSLDQPIRLADREYIDLTRESGLRFWIRSSAERTVLTIQVHHACTDGTGVYRFLGDLLRSMAPRRPLPGSRLRRWGRSICDCCESEERDSPIWH